MPGLVISVDERVLRGPQIREALGAVFALHIDTARTWRGGQNQVLLTVLGLRALGHRAVLVAHPEGELYRRASEGPDLVPLAPRNEVDLSSAWKLSRIIRQWKPQIVHAHDPHAVAMAALALSFGAPDPRPRVVASRRVDFHLQRHSFSRWKYRQVDLFIAASDAIRDILEHDGIAPIAIVVVHDGIDVGKIERLPVVDVHAEFWLPHGAPVLIERRRAGRPQGPEVPASRRCRTCCARCPTRTCVIFGEGELRAPLERQIKELHLEKHVLLPGFREDVLQLMKSADLFVMSSITEGLGSTVLDAMAMRLRRGRHARRRHSRSGRARRDRAARRAGGAARARRRDRPAAEGSRAAPAAWATPATRASPTIRRRTAARRHAAGLSPRRADEADGRGRDLAGPADRQTVIRAGNHA